MTDKKNIKNLNQALEYIEELEKGLQDAIEILIKRDDQLSAAEHKICKMESRMEDLEEAAKKPKN